MDTNHFWHGSTRWHDYLLKGSWISSSIDEAVLFAFLRSQERNEEAFIARIDNPQIEECFTMGRFENATLKVNTNVHKWFSMKEISDLISCDMKKIILNTRQVIDITHLIK